MAANPNDTLDRGRGRPPGARHEREAEIGYYPVAEEPSDAVALRYETLALRISHWIFANPGKPLTICARELGLSAQYLYYFTASDTFKAKHEELINGEGGFKSTIMGNLSERLRGAAFQALDQLTGKMALDPSNDFILDASEVLIKAAVSMERPTGGGVAVQVNNNYPVIPQDVLERTQQQMFLSAPPAPAVTDGSVTVEHDGAGLQTPK